MGKEGILKLHIYILDEPDMPPIVVPTTNPVIDIDWVNERGVYVDREGTRCVNFESIHIGEVQDFTWYPPHRISKIVAAQEDGNDC
jgi:hypothetical protein